MTASYNVANRRYELNGDGTGLQRVRFLLPTPPTGTNQAIYVLRMSTDQQITAGEVVTGDSAFCFGLSFDGVYPQTTEASTSQYDNFFGPACSDSSAPYTTFVLTDNGGNQVMSLSSTGSDGFVYDANGGNIDSDHFLGVSVSLDNSTSRELHLMQWVVTTDLVTNAVDYKLLTNNNSIDLSDADLENDIDPDSPETAFGESWTTDYSGQLHGDTTGTNWRPTSGVMAFPTHYMAANPSRNFDVAIHYVGVQYSTLTV